MYVPIGWVPGQKNRGSQFDGRKEAPLLGIVRYVGIPLVQVRPRTRPERILAGTRYLLESLQQDPLFFIAALSSDQDTRNVQGEFGPNFDYYLRPFARTHLKDMDPTKSRLLTFRVGYRYLPTLRGVAPRTEAWSN